MLDSHATLQVPAGDVIDDYGALTRSFPEHMPGTIRIPNMHLPGSSHPQVTQQTDLAVGKFARFCSIQQCILAYMERLDFANKPSSYLPIDTGDEMGN